MKLKTKLLTALTGTALLVPALGSIASCTFSRDEGYTCPTVTYNGSTEMNPGSSVTTQKLSGFKFSRPLMSGENVKVNVIDVANGSKLSVKPTYSANSDNMSIQFTISVSDKYSNATAKCKLTFEFTYEDNVQTYDGLDKIFTFNYSPQWKEISVLGTLGNYTVSDDGKSFTIDYDDSSPLGLSRDIDKSKGETLNVTTNDPNITCKSWATRPQGTGEAVQLKLEFDVKLESTYDDYDNTDFGLTFTIKLNGETKKTITRQSGKVHFTRKYDQAKVMYSETATTQFNLIEANVDNDGLVSYALTDDVLSLNRRLSTKYGENLTLELYDESSDIPLSENLSLTYSTSSLSIKTPKLIFEPTATSHSYEDANINFRIHYKVAETPEVARTTSEGFVATEQSPDTPIVFNFKFTPIWKEKSVVPFGFESSKQFKPSTGSWQYQIVSSTKAETPEPTAAGFYIDNVLDDAEKVTVALEKVSGEDAKVLNEEVLPTVITVDGNKRTYIDFDLAFVNQSNPTIDHTASFKFKFTFHKGTFKYTQTIADTFSLVYTPASSGSLYVSDTTGAAGNTLIKLTGQIVDNNHTATQLKNALKSVSLTEIHETDRSLTLIHGKTIDNPDGTYNYINDDKTIQLNVLIDPTNGSIGEDFIINNLKFEFTDASGITYPELNGVKVTYSPFSTNLEDYVKVRTVPLCIYAKRTRYSSYIDRFFIQTWIVGKYNGTVQHSNYSYWVATTMSNKLAYEKFKTKHSDSYDKRLGITDSTFESSYTNDEGTNINACNYQNNYLYCPLDTIHWEDDSNFVWASGSSNAANLAVGWIDFNQSFQDIKQTIVNNAEWEASYINKLGELNQYSQTYNGKINDVLANPITSDKLSNYSEFGFGGYYTWQDRWNDDVYGKFNINNNQTLTNWIYYNIPNEVGATQVNYDSDGLNGQNIMYYDPGTSFSSGTSSFSSASTSYTYGSYPMYCATSATNNSGNFDGYDLASNWPVVGSVVVTKYKGTLASDEAPIKVVGIYIGWDSSGFGKKSAFDFVPYIDIVSYNGKNLLSNYL